MNTEQRALATLDLTLKNAFETLNKFALWAQTPDSDVTFNLVDAVPTINSSGSGIFLKPLTVPSFASIRSNIFGTPDTTAIRSLYWNLDFKAVTGWTFESDSAVTPATLKVLVNTIFGDVDNSISISKTNVKESQSNTITTLDYLSKIFQYDTNNKRIFNITSTDFEALQKNIVLGTANTSKIRMNVASFVLSTSENTLDNILSYYEDASGNRNLHIGPYVSYANQAKYQTFLNTGSLAVRLSNTKNLDVSFYDSTSKKGSIFSAIYNANTNTYDYFIASGLSIFPSLNIGTLSTLNISANELDITGSFGEILSTISNDEYILKISSKNNLILSSETKTSLGSKTQVNIGIEDSDGTISNEIVITKSSVKIPNLYVQKKSNYILSGIKHIAEGIINPSVVYYSDSVAKTHCDNAYAFEYSKNIKSQVFEETSRSDFATTINNLSGSIKSYLIMLVDDGIELRSANVSYINSKLVVTSKYAVVGSATGLSSIHPYVANSQLKMISTPNGMYVFVHEIINAIDYYNVYYSIDAMNFTLLHSYDISNNYIFDVSIDYVTVSTVDYIWFTHQIMMNITSTYYCEYYWGYTYTLFYLENNCSVVNAIVYNLDANQITAGNDVGGVSGNKYALYGSTHKVIAYPDGNGKSYALILGAYGATWYHSVHHKGIGATIAGGKGTLDKNASGTRYAHAIVLKKYVANTNYLAESDAIAFGTDDGNGTDFLSDSEILDFSWDDTAKTGNAIVSSSSSTKTVSFNSTKEILSSELTNKTTKYSQALHCISATKIIQKLLVNISNPIYAFICGTENDVTYVVNNTMADSIYSHIMSTQGVIYYDSNTSAIIYYDNGDGGVVKDSIEVIINKSVANEVYDLSGALVDYLGVNYIEYGSFFTNFVLSSISGGDFSLNNTKEYTDRRVYVEKNNNDITSIIESANSAFSPTNISSVISGAYNKAKSILVSISNIYNIYGEINEQYPIVQSSASSSDIGALNFHVEPISYLVKNRNMNITTLEIGNYTITKNSTTGVYSIISSDNQYSGYRIPYTTDRDANFVVSIDQATFSNKASGAPESFDMNSSLDYFYVTIDNEYCHVHNNSSITNSIIIVSIPFGMIDPTDATFDPSSAIVNEFSNVVSLKLPYMFAVRSQNCGSYINKGKSNIILGLTEVAEIGGGC